MRSVKKQNQTSGVKEKNYNQDNKSITELKPSGTIAYFVMSRFRHPLAYLVIAGIMNS